jgi:tetratricopeptide (TPR) repeat protein
MRKLLSLLAAVMLVAAAAPAGAGNPPRWIEIRSPNFTVLSDASERDARHVAAQLERRRQVFRVLMPTAKEDAAAPITVLALRDRQGFRALEPEAYLARNQLDLAGLFLRSQDHNYILMRLDSNEDHPYSTIYHEYTHYMLRSLDEWMPLWMNEGLAEFYQNADLRDPTNVRVGQASPDDILYLRDSKLLPLTTLLMVDHNSPYYHDEEKGSVFYAESWALTHFIVIGDFEHKTHRLQDYARFLIQHEDPVTAAQHAFGDLKQLQQALEGYVRQTSFQEFRLSAPMNFTEASFGYRPVPTPEADTVRADVLLNVQRPHVAEDLLKSVLAVDPQNALAHETMGELEFRANNIPAARKWFGEAVQLDSKSYLAHYYFAVMTLQSGDFSQSAAVEQSLRTATQLNPKFAPAFDALANFYAQRHEHLDEAHLLNATAISLGPEVLAYRMNAANVLGESGKYADALSVLKEAQRVAKTPSEKQMVSQRISYVQDFQRTQQEVANRRQRIPSDNSNVTVNLMNGDHEAVTIPAAPEQAPYPDQPAKTPHHTLAGVIHNVKCSYPTVLTLTLDRPGKPVALYTNNYFKVTFTTLNFQPTDALTPCKDIEGMKARIEFGDVTDPRVAGQIVSIQLSK